MSASPRDLFVIALGRLAQAACLLFSVRVMTTTLSAEEVGRVNLIFGVMNWYVTLLLAPIFNYFYRRTASWRDGATLSQHFLRDLPLYHLLIAAIALLTWGPIFNGLAGVQLSMLWVIAFIFGHLVLREWLLQPLMALNFLGRRTSYAAFLTVVAWCGLGASVALTRFVAPRAEYWLAGPILATVALAVFFIPVFRWTAQDRWSPFALPERRALAHWSQVFHYAWPQLVFALLIWVQMYGYRLIMNQREGVEALGLFGIGFSLGAMPIMLFSQVYNELLIPRFYHHVSQHDLAGQTGAWNEVGAIYFPALVTTVAFVIAAVPLVAPFLLGPAFQSAATLAVWGTLATAGAQATSVIAAAGHARMNTRLLIMPNVAGAAIAVGGVLLLGPAWPLHGVGLALTLATLTSTLLIAYRVRGVLPVRWPWMRVLVGCLTCLPVVVPIVALRTLLPLQTFIHPFVTLGYLTLGGLYIAAVQLCFGWSVLGLTSLSFLRRFGPRQQLAKV